MRRTIIVLVVILIVTLCPQVQTTALSDDESALLYQPDLELSVSAPAAIVLSAERSQRLYTKQAEKTRSLPAASQLMTALIGCERLPLSTPITISSVAAQAAEKEKTNDGVTLQTGDKYSAEYLLLRLLFYHSNAAAIAIAEQISNVEEAFVALMNAKADQIEMYDTFFLNATGKPVYESGNKGDDITNPKKDNPAVLAPLQYSTVGDLAKLMSYAMKNTTFALLFQKDSEYLAVKDNHLISMHNGFRSIGILSERRVSGAYYCESEEQSYTVVVATIRNFQVLIVTAGGSPSQRVQDALTIINGVEARYVQSFLVTAGQSFEGYLEETEDGDVIGLVYRRSIQYIHPIDDDFVQSDLTYLSQGPHRRPIEYGKILGQVVFKLEDGTIISADVGPNRQILSRITLLNKLFVSLQNNLNLYYLVVACCLFLLLSLLYQLTVQTLRLVRLAKILNFENRSRR